MRPDDPQLKNTSLFIPQRPTMSGGSSSSTSTQSSAQQDAVADMTRQHIDEIYQNDPNSTMVRDDTKDDESSDSFSTQTAHTQDEAANTELTEENEIAPAYQRTHDENAATQQLSPEWQKYHSAWQSYYQKYFHSYYAGHIQQTHSALAAESAKSKNLEEKNKELLLQAQSETPEEAIDTLRGQIRQQVRSRAKAVRKSRHFLPIAAACGVMLVFLFLQYNRVLFAYIEAYTSPGTSVPDNIIVDPTTTIAVSDEPRLIIPKLSIDVPAIYENTMGRTNKETYDLQMAAMSKGVAWFAVPKANSRPGQIGNVVLSGHSSSEWFETGDYKFIFARLEQMTIDDTIYLNYEGIRYSYKITKKEVVLPSNVAALQYDTVKPMLTLITCVPLGTADKRLLVTAEQISPDPSTARPAPTNGEDTDAMIPGQSETLLERLIN